MAIRNTEIAELFYRMAELLEIEGATPFRARAYRRAAIAVEGLSESAVALIARGVDLADLPAIGDDLAGKIKEICQTGRLKALEDVEARTPSQLAALSAVPGVGPKRLRVLYERLGIRSPEALRIACAEGKVRQLPGFSEAFEKKLLSDLRNTLRRPDSEPGASTL